jgi:hypothetical protein
MYVNYNPNSVGITTDDCAVRAIAKALDVSWDMAYMMLAMNGMKMGFLMNSNSVIASVLRSNGFRRANIPNTCPDCFTIQDFMELNPNGVFVLGTGTHVVATDGGDVYDTWNSLDEVPIYVWYENVAPKFE